MQIAYSKSLYWFNQVRWDEKNCFVNCLVSVSSPLREGYWVIEEAGSLKLRFYNPDDAHKAGKVNCLGWVEKREFPIIGEIDRASHGLQKKC